MEVSDPGGAPARSGGALSLLLSRLGGIAGALAAAQLATGLTYVVAARAIEPATLGLVATCVAIATIAAVVFDAGLTDLLVREVAAGRIERTGARAAVAAKRRLAVLPVILVSAATLWIAPDPVSGLLLGFLGLACWEAQTANGMLRARERFRHAATAQIVGRFSGLGVVVIVQFAAPVAALPAALLVSFAAEALIGRLYLGPGARATPQREMVGLYRDGVGYGLSSLAASAQQLDTPLVALGGGAASAGLYTAAGRLLGPLGFLPTSLSLVGAPWLARSGADRAALLAEERRVLRIAALLCVFPLLAAVAGPWAVPLVLGADYQLSGTVFAVLAVGSVLSTMNQPLAMIVQNRRRQRSVALAVGIGLGIGLVATYVLAVIGGPVLAAVGFTASQAYILVHLALVARRLRAPEPEPVA